MAISANLGPFALHLIQADTEAINKLRGVSQIISAILYQILYIQFGYAADISFSPAFWTP
jgi:hypothetical protein